MKYDRTKIDALYREREERLEDLATRYQINMCDIVDMDRLGLCEVSNRMWKKCSPETQRFLLSHQHHYVRSCASVAMTQRSAHE